MRYDVIVVGAGPAGSTAALSDAAAARPAFTADIAGGEPDQQGDDGDSCQPSGAGAQVIDRYHASRLQARQHVGGLDGRRLEKLCGMEAPDAVVVDTQFEGCHQPLRQFGRPPLDVEGDTVKGQAVAHSPPQSKSRQTDAGQEDDAEQNEAP